MHKPQTTNQPTALPAWLEIDTRQFARNLTETKRLIGNSKLCAVMKADAYGLGIDNLLPTVIAHDIPFIAVTDNSEIKTIRRHRRPEYAGNILRIRPATAEEITEAVPFRVEEMAGQWENARLLSECAVAAGVTIKMHFKLNSAGMGRNGLDLSTSSGKTEALHMLQLPGLKVVGLMTHFPKEDKKDIVKSLARFQSDCRWLIKHGQLNRRQLCLHAANSYAVLANAATHLDMVRPGSLLYGDGLLPDFEGFPHILTFKSRIVGISSYPAGNSISYEREHILTRDSRIATVLVGYANGYRRIFSHRGHFLIRNRRAPIIGRVSMNVSTVDVTDIPEAQIGDEVVIFGCQGNESISQNELESVNQALFADLYSVWGCCNPKVLV